jgi:two-component system, chemotaxis family, CheB/CheR fusion protein
MPKRTPEAGKPPKNVADTDHAAAPGSAARRALVVCGGSAGGLEAFSLLLAALPAHVNAAFVIVPHLAPEHASMMSQLLQHQTALSVAEAVDGAPLEAGHVHVAPPGMAVAVRDGRLQLTPRLDGVAFHPIDHCFRSLADNAGERLIAVVLSGTGADGAAGIRDVRGAGGITMAQTPDSAKYDGMPSAAIATNAIDVVLPPAELAREIARIADSPSADIVEAAAQLPADAPAEAVRDENLQRVFAMLRGATGVDFRQYKMPTIERRLQRRLLLHRLTRLDDYVRVLRESPSEVLALYGDILIHVTRFFREPESFEALTDRVFPRLIADHKGDHPLRAWVAGCSTGEEAYSLAIALLEALGDDAARIPVQIFATDVSEDAIQRARMGTYPASIVSDVSAERMRRFFTKLDGSYRIAKSVRDVCVFARQDVTRDPPFSRLDLILCRNVLIYLSAALQRRLMNVFHYALKPGRFLVLGHAETIGTHADMFQLEDRKHRIYSRKGLDVAAAPFAVDTSGIGQVPVRPAGPPRDDLRSIQAEANRVLLDRYAPAGVVIDEEQQIVHFRGATGPYLEPAAGDPSLHLFKMAREGLLQGLRTAVNEARLSGRAARKDGVRVRQNGGWRPVNVEVVPLSGPDKRHFLVLFESASAAEREAEVQVGQTEAPTADPSIDGRVQSLEEEIAASRAYLQSIIHELEAANEELQSANEEILSSNEELQSTNEELDTAKEELQSTNEELNTVNDELHGRNEELSRVNSDLINILSSVQIAILIVSSDLRIRRFTPMAERMLNLIGTDVGRPIGHIKPNFDIPDLEELIREVIDAVTTIEREVRDRQGRWYALRVRPYKNVDNRIDGAVLSLFDIDALHRQEVELRETRHYAEAVVEAVRQPLVVLDHDLRVRTANATFLATAKLGIDAVRGRPFLELGDGEWNGEALREALERMANGGPDDHVGVRHVSSGGVMRSMLVEARRIEGPAGRPSIILLAFTNRDAEADDGKA